MVFNIDKFALENIRINVKCNFKHSGLLSPGSLCSLSAFPGHRVTSPPFGLVRSGLFLYSLYHTCTRKSTLIYNLFSKGGIIIQDLKTINSILKYSTRKELDQMKRDLALTERQLKIFYLKYEQGKPVNFIADSLGFSARTIESELRTIRHKIGKLI